MNTYVWKRTE